MRQKNQRILSDDEIDALLEAAKPEEEEVQELEKPDRDYFLIKTTLLHGLRNSEARNLRRKHIDMDNRVVEVVDSKGGKDRKVPLPSKFAGEIKPYLRFLDEDELLFPSRKTGGKLTQRGFEWLVSRHALEAGLYPEGVEQGELDEIPYRERVMPHTLRHTYATRLLRNGEPMQKVSKALGHEDIEVTVNVYSHLNVEDVREGVEDLEITGLHG
ncbi:MAG: tyrosine-type recombinase/integrase [Candidatus Aenigmatarchaeota archaeon]